VHHIFRMPRPTNFKLGVQVVYALATGGMTSKVKGQGRKVTWSVWAVLAQYCKPVPVSLEAGGGHTVSAEPGGHTFCFVERSTLSVSQRRRPTCRNEYECAELCSRRLQCLIKWTDKMIFFTTLICCFSCNNSYWKLRRETWKAK